MLDSTVQRMDGRRLHPMVFHAMLAMLEGLTLRLIGRSAKASEVAAARQVAHALAAQILGAPGVKPIPLPELPAAKRR